MANENLITCEIRSWQVAVGWPPSPEMDLAGSRRRNTGPYRSGWRLRPGREEPAAPRHGTAPNGHAVAQTLVLVEGILPIAAAPAVPVDAAGFSGRR